MEHGCSRLHDRVESVVEVAVGVLHVANRPLSHAARQLKALRVAASEVRQGFDRLRRTLTVDRLRPIVVITRTPVLVEEVPFEKLKA
jgi:hypothetical protein